MRAKELQAAKIRQIADALIARGYISLNEQAGVLGLSRSTTWDIIRGTHKNSGLSGAVINRMLAQPRLPQAARARILEYVEDKSAGIYGHTPSQVWRFLEAISPFRPATNPDTGFFDTAASADDHISVRDWRRKPPLRLRATTNLLVH
jgi:hypothetical protein